jgi:hypothetical protein
MRSMAARGRQTSLAPIRLGTPPQTLEFRYRVLGASDCQRVRSDGCGQLRRFSTGVPLVVPSPVRLHKAILAMYGMSDHTIAVSQHSCECDHWRDSGGSPKAKARGSPPRASPADSFSHSRRSRWVCSWIGRKAHAARDRRGRTDPRLLAVALCEKWNETECACNAQTRKLQEAGRDEVREGSRRNFLDDHAFSRPVAALPYRPPAPVRACNRRRFAQRA